MSRTHLLLPLLAILTIATAAHAQKPVAEGGYYTGTLDGREVRMELRRYATRRGSRFECIIDGPEPGRYKLDGTYRAGRYHVTYVSLDHRELARGAKGEMASLVVGKGEIRGAIPDSSGRGRLSFSGERIAIIYGIERALPNDGYLGVSYPHFVGGSRGARSSINRAIESYIAAHLRSIASDASDADWEEGMVNNNQISSDLNLAIFTYSPSLITLFAVHDISYNGGRSFNDYEGLNYVLEGDTLRRVRLRDLFLAGSGYLGRLRSLIAARADSLVHITYADTPDIFEVEEEPVDSSEAARRLDTLDELSDDLVTFRIAPEGGLSFFALCRARYPIYEDVWIDLEEIGDMIDPKGPLARFLTENPPPHR